MKMKVINRILLALYALIGVLALGYGVACLIWPQMGYYVSALWGSHNGLLEKTVVCAALVVLIVWSIRLFILAFQREPRNDCGSVAVQNTDDGAVRVSVGAMETLVRQAIGQSEGIVNLKTRIINHEDSISVHIEMALTSDSHIPNITMTMQRNIKRHIEEYSGIAVREVVIMVADIRALEAPAPQPSAESNLKAVIVEPEKVETPVHADAAAAEGVIPQERVAEEPAVEEFAAEEGIAEEFAPEEYAPFETEAEACATEEGIWEEAVSDSTTDGETAADETAVEAAVPEETEVVSALETEEEAVAEDARGGMEV